MRLLPTPNPARRSSPARALLRSLSLLLLAGASMAGIGCSSEDATARDIESSAPPEGVSTPAPRAGTAWVIFATDTVVAEVAVTADQRAQGLMFREQVPDGTGMLFVFDRQEVQSFWMQNTYVNLDIAFMDAGFRIVDIQQMEAESTEFHESAAPALYALEVREGWFGERGIAVGDVAQVRFGG